MAARSKNAFSRRLADPLTDELVIALSDGQTYDFRALFTKVFEGIKRKKAASGGEEMLRLRSYEKLLALAKRGFVSKCGRSFTGLSRLQEASSTHKPETASK